MNIIQEENEIIAIEQSHNRGKDFYFQSKRNKAYVLNHMDSMHENDLRELAIKILELPRNTRRSEELQVLRRLISNVEFFKQFVNDNDYDALDYCIRTLSIEKFNQGQIIYNAGDPAYKFYLILEGKVLLYIQNQQEQRSGRRHSQSLDYTREPIQSIRNRSSDLRQRNITKITDLRENQLFGENSIIEGRVRQENAITEAQTTFAVLMKEDYQNAVQIIDKKKLLKNMNSFKHNPSFSTLNKKLLNILLFTFNSVEYKFRQIVYKQYQIDQDACIYIVKSGEFLVYKYAVLQDQHESKTISQQQPQNQSILLFNTISQKIRQNVAVLTPGSLFGDIEAFNNSQRMHTVQCNTGQGVVIQISLSSLTSKLQGTNEQYLLNQLKTLCKTKNLWHTEFLKYTSQTQQEYSKYLSNIQKTVPNKPLIPPVVSEDNQNIGFMTSIQSQRETVLPKLKLISSMRQQQQTDRLATPERYSLLVKSKFQIIGKIHNISNEQSKNLNLQTFQQETILVKKPKALQSRNNTEWPIQANLYLNDLDDSKYYQSQFRSKSMMNDGQQINFEKKGKIDQLRKILKQQMKPKKRKKNQALLGVKNYLEEHSELHTTYTYPLQYF